MIAKTTRRASCRITNQTGLGTAAHVKIGDTSRLPFSGDELSFQSATLKESQCLFGVTAVRVERTQVTRPSLSVFHSSPWPNENGYRSFKVVHRGLGSNPGQGAPSLFSLGSE